MLIHLADEIFNEEYFERCRSRELGINAARVRDSFPPGKRMKRKYESLFFLLKGLEEPYSKNVKQNALIYFFY